MATRAILTPQSAEFPASAMAPLTAKNQRMALAYDAATAETAYWTLVAPQGMATPLVAVLSYIMDAATTGGVAFEVSVEAVTSGDATDLDAVSSFDTVNTGTQASVPATAGYLQQMSITLTNADAIAAADYVRISVTRAVANAADTATGDCLLLAVELRDAA